MNKLALVTGASSGIGNAFARRLAADEYDLVAVGRRVGRLKELAASLTNVKVQTLVADLSTDEGIDAVAEVCASQPLTVLVNDAGVAHVHADYRAFGRQSARAGPCKSRCPDYVGPSRRGWDG